MTIKLETIRMPLGSDTRYFKPDRKDMDANNAQAGIERSLDYSAKAVIALF